MPLSKDQLGRIHFKHFEEITNFTDDFEFAASLLLSEPLPEGWQKRNDEKLLQYVNENSWEPFECWDPELVINEIENIALAVGHYVKNQTAYVNKLRG